MKTDIILVNYNGADDTVMCVESLWAMQHQNFRIIIVENGSTDSSRKVLEKFVQSNKGIIIDESALSSQTDNSLLMITATTNRGFSSGNNIGIRLSLETVGTDYVWLLNNDTIVDSDALGSLITAHHNYKQSIDQNPGILGSRVKFYHNKNIIQAIGGTFNPRKGNVALIGFNKQDGPVYQQPNTYDMVLGASMFVDVDFIKKVGPLNEDYFLYFEELDWSLRAKKLGFATRYEPGSIVYHKQGKSTGNNVLGKKSEIACTTCAKATLPSTRLIIHNTSFACAC